MITTRLRDTAFKRVFRSMPLGTPVKIEGPFGDLRLYHANRPAVWREAPVFSAREWAALAWTEAITLLPQTGAPGSARRRLDAAPVHLSSSDAS